ncbi:MAG TPA: BON domain-containing protein [Terriglobales bacterium]|nr:BON domain-containing protein [Terriglobales bacterium]
MTDLEVKRAVESELTWEPSVNAAGIGVSVQNGVVTLGGTTPSYLESWRAERAAARVQGVRSVTNDIEVQLPRESERADAELARAAASALEWSAWVPAGVKAKVERGWVTLEGKVDWAYQKRAAEKAVRDLMGVKGVINMVAVTPRVSVGDVQTAIQSALERSAQLDASRIKIEADGDRITLRGAVRSWSEKQSADYAAWSAPGVRYVDNQLTVDPALAA